jgi:hypothetical protein
MNTTTNQEHTTQEADDEEWDWFQHITEADLAYLTAPREYPEPCPWCGLRLSHTPACKQLHDEWSMPMPFGQYRGIPVRRVPKSYLTWLLVESDLTIGDELREEIESVLRPRGAAGVEQLKTCRCGSTEFRDFPIHDGQSTRRDCGQCGRFIAFVRWYGRIVE